MHHILIIYTDRTKAFKHLFTNSHTNNTQLDILIKKDEFKLKEILNILLADLKSYTFELAKLKISTKLIIPK